MQPRTATVFDLRQGLSSQAEEPSLGRRRRLSRHVRLQTSPQHLFERESRTYPGGPFRTAIHNFRICTSFEALRSRMPYTHSVHIVELAGGTDLLDHRTDHDR